MEPAELRATAVDVLTGNDVEGRYTRPAAGLYPHQWSWDSAITAVGWAYLDGARAATELRSLFAAQWTDGRVPHIVYHGRGGYFPDAGRWRTAEVPSAPPVATSGLVQPPVHALATWRLWEVTNGAFEIGDLITALYPALVRWHRYLHERRDDGRGGVVIWHPWESGTDNAPRWDVPLAAIVPEPRPVYARADLPHVDEPGQRPTDAEYDRYVWLLDRLADARYDDRRLADSHPFQVTDVLSTAILVVADGALERIAEVAGAPSPERDEIAAWARRGADAVSGARDAATGLYLDRDYVTGAPLPSRTIAGFAGLVAGIEPQLDTLLGPDFCGALDLAHPLPPTTSPADPGFAPRSYWRGPVWPVTTWLLWDALRRSGEADVAAALRDAQLDALANAGMAEYLDPFSGEPLGASSQSWTAAVALDLLADHSTQV